jgi:hypothetical protein
MSPHLRRLRRPDDDGALCSQRRSHHPHPLAPDLHPTKTPVSVLGIQRGPPQVELKLPENPL